MKWLPLAIYNRTHYEALGTTNLAEYSLSLMSLGDEDQCLDTVKGYRYWYQYPFEMYRIIAFHSLKVLLTILTTVKLSFIRYCPETET